MFWTARGELSGGDSEGFGEISGCDLDGSGGKCGLGGTFWLIWTARGEFSGCDSDDLGGSFWV